MQCFGGQSLLRKDSVRTRGGGTIQADPVASSLSLSPSVLLGPLSLPPTADRLSLSLSLSVFVISLSVFSCLWSSTPGPSLPARRRVSAYFCLWIRLALAVRVKVYFLYSFWKKKDSNSWRRKTKKTRDIAKRLSSVGRKVS